MSYQTSQSLYPALKEGVFSGGMCDNVQQVDMAEHLSPYLRNCRLDGRSIIIRKGHSLFATLTAGDYPRGIGSYLRTIASNDRIVVRHNTDATHKLYTITEAGVATSILTNSDIASDNRMWFQNVADVVYCMNGSDKFGKLNGTTYTTPTSATQGLVITATTSFTLGETITGGTSAATGTVSKLLNNKLGVLIKVISGTFVAAEVITGGTSGLTATISSVNAFCPAFSVIFAGSHWVSGRSVFPNAVFKSVGDNYEDFTSTGSDVYTFGEQVTGLSANSQALFYFTKNTIAITGINDITDTAGTLTFSNRALQALEGAVNHWGIIEAGSDTYYLSAGNALNMIAPGQNVNGFEVVPLSDREYKGITNLMATLDPDQTASFGLFYPEDNLIKRNVETTGATFNNLVITYDVVHKAFLPDNSKFFYDGIYFKGKKYTVSMIEPKVYLDEYGQADEDSPIPFEYRTKEFYISDVTYKKILREARTLVDINRLASLTQYIYIDGVQRDDKTIDSDNVPISTGGIGTEAIGTFAIGTEGLTAAIAADDYNEVIILRTKGDLNKKGIKVQFRYSCGTLAAKVRLKSLSMKVEVLPGEATNLTT